ncbi:unnamed protein product [Ixodes hexagonus]
MSSPDCSKTNASPLCGSDGRTYSSQCEVERARCEGHLVEVKHEGQCPADARRCWSQRSQAQEQVRSGASGVFVPDCNPDGGFVQVQCHRLTGYCWCVDAQGKVLSGSSVQNRRPNCTHPDKKTTFQRRAPRRGLPKKGCTNADRSQFNANLVDIFTKEFKRLPNQPTPARVPLARQIKTGKSRARAALTFTRHPITRESCTSAVWSKDGRVVSKLPKIPWRESCMYCRGISASSVTVDAVVSFRLFMSLNSDEEHGGGAAEAATPSTAKPAHRDRAPAASRPTAVSRTALQDTPTGDGGGADEFLLTKVSRSRVVIGGGDEDDDRNDGERLQPPGGIWGDPDSRLNSGTRFTDDQDVYENKEDDEVQDCSSARRLAQEAHRLAPKGRIYVPECGSDGNYAEAQCHTGYCWCVNQRTGRPIRGIATLGVKPDCAAARLLARSFKGCSYKKKQTFLTELVNNFRREKERNARSGTAPITRDEAVRWKFSSLDVNLNKVLERREWKPFRRGWKDFLKNGSRPGGGRKKLRKCWRNFLRYCDEDADNRVTFDEWIKCTEQAPVPETSTRLPTNPNRKGPNPFATILRST